MVIGSNNQRVFNDQCIKGRATYNYMLSLADNDINMFVERLKEIH